MKSFTRSILGLGARLLPWSWGSWLSGQSVVLPFYHTVSPSFLPYLSPLYALRSPVDFERELDAWLRVLEPLALEDLPRALELGRSGFHLSFDDGLRGVYDYVLPILRRKGVPATLFVNTDFVDNQTVFFRFLVALALHRELFEGGFSLRDWVYVWEGYGSGVVGLGGRERLLRLRALRWSDAVVLARLAEVLAFDGAAFLRLERPFMTWGQLSEWLGAGMSLGSHGRWHEHYEDKDLEAVLEDYRVSRGVLEQRLGLPCRDFAFPFGGGGLSASVLEALHEWGGCRLSFGVAGPKWEGGALRYRHLHRWAIEAEPLLGGGDLGAYYLRAGLKRCLGRMQMRRV